MNSKSMVLIDANVLIYYLDETSDNHTCTINQLQKLVDNQDQLVTSHHILEEVLFILSKNMPEASLVGVVDKISKLPTLILVEPAPNINFARRFAELAQKFNMGVNDALLLQLMLDAGINKLFTYDKKFAARAAKLDIN